MLVVVRGKNSLVGTIGEIGAEHKLVGTIGETGAEHKLVGNIAITNGISLPGYEGEFEIIPSTDEDQVLRTAKTIVESDIVVAKIPYAEVRNNSGGETVTIGG